MLHIRRRGLDTTAVFTAEIKSWSETGLVQEYELLRIMFRSFKALRVQLCVVCRKSKSAKDIVVSVYVCMLQDLVVSLYV